MHYIALDFGEKRIGVAGSDSGTVITPLGIIHIYPKDDPLQKVIHALQKYNPEEIIIGLALSKEGSVTQSAHRARTFGEALMHHFPHTSLHFINEILTTFEARRRAGRKAGEAIDDHAAAVILEQYITEHKKINQ